MPDSYIWDVEEGKIIEGIDQKANITLNWNTLYWDGEKYVCQYITETLAICPECGSHDVRRSNSRGVLYCNDCLWVESTAWYFRQLRRSVIKLIDISLVYPLLRIINRFIDR